MKYFHERYPDCPASSSPRRTAARSAVAARTVDSDLASPSDAPSVKFDDFSYWKPILPVLLDAEIAALLNSSRSQEENTKPEAVKWRPKDGDNNTKNKVEADVSPAFNEFNFWRVPVMEINDLLASIKL